MRAYRKKEVSKMSNRSQQRHHYSTKHDSGMVGAIVSNQYSSKIVYFRLKYKIKSEIKKQILILKEVFIRKFDWISALGYHDDMKLFFC